MRFGENLGSVNACMIAIFDASSPPSNLKGPRRARGIQELPRVLSVSKCQLLQPSFSWQICAARNSIHVTVAFWCSHQMCCATILQAIPGLDCKFACSPAGLLIGASRTAELAVTHAGCLSLHYPKDTASHMWLVVGLRSSRDLSTGCVFGLSSAFRKEEEAVLRCTKCGRGNLFG